MTRTADRDGIMVWSEIPNWQGISFDKPEVYAKDVVMLNEMIRRDRNKASVILWSVSNEISQQCPRFRTEFASPTSPTKRAASIPLAPSPPR